MVTSSNLASYVLIGKLMNPKPEKDEGADKYVTDKEHKERR